MSCPDVTVTVSYCRSTGGCIVGNICGGGRAPPSPSSFESARVCTVIVVGGCG